MSGFPNFSSLVVGAERTPIGEFYPIPKEEYMRNIKNNETCPFTLVTPPAYQGILSNEATFRLPDQTGRLYNIYDAKSLWNWIKNQDVQVLNKPNAKYLSPLDRQPIRRSDYELLKLRYGDPEEELPPSTHFKPEGPEFVVQYETPDPYPGGLPIDLQRFMNAMSEVRENGLTLARYKGELRSNKEIVLAAVRQNGLALEYADNVGPNLQNDRDVVRRAVVKNGLALQYADPRLKADGKVVTAAVLQNGLALEHAAVLLKDDIAILMSAMHQNPDAIQHASERLKQMTETELKTEMIEHLKNDAEQFILSPLSLQSDPVAVVTVVQQDGFLLRSASVGMRENRAVVIRAVMQNGLALEVAGDTMRQEYDVVQAAVIENGLALEFAPPFQNNPEMVQRAVQSNGLALQFATGPARANLDIVREAIRENPQSYFYCDFKEMTELAILAMQTVFLKFYLESGELRNPEPPWERFAREFTSACQTILRSYVTKRNAESMPETDLSPIFIQLISRAASAQFPSEPRPIDLFLTATFEYEATEE